jgi:hypothetical protein
VPTVKATCFYRRITAAVKYIFTFFAPDEPRKQNLLADVPRRHATDYGPADSKIDSATPSPALHAKRQDQCHTSPVAPEKAQTIDHFQAYPFKSLLIYGRGMIKVWPTFMCRASSLGLAAISDSTLTPYFRAMKLGVSCALTVWVRGVEAGADNRAVPGESDGLAWPKPGD